MSKKTNRFIFISAGIVGVLVIIAIVVITQVGTSGDEENVPEGDPISFQDFLVGNFSTQRFNGSWGDGANIIWKTADGSLVKYNVETGLSTSFVSSETMGLVSDTATFVAFAPNNLNLLLFYDNVEYIWRHSFYANYIVLDASTNQTYSIEPPAITESGTKLRLATWRSGSQKNEIIFVYDNNIYLRQNLTDNSATTKLTKDGVVDQIYNGIPDWVYEEEVLGSNAAMYSSEDGKYLAYAQFNDSKVQSFYYTKYGEPEEPLDNLYTNNINLPYPKVGTENPTIKIFVKDLTYLNGTAMEVQPPSDFLSQLDDSNEYIFFRIYWIKTDRLGVIWMNRVQNKGVHSECIKNATSSNWNCFTVLKNEESKGWLTIQNPQYNSGGTGFLQVLPHLQSNGLHYQHLAFINSLNTVDKNPVFLTKGEIYVTGIIGWSEPMDKIFFTATAEGNPGARHLYVTRNGSSDAMKCITCGLHLNDGESECTYNAIQMNSDFHYYVHSCTGPGIGEITVRRVDDNSIVRMLQDHSKVKERLTGKKIPEIIRLSVDIPNSKFKAPVMMRLPPGYDSSGSKKYPLIIYVYGGPESQMVNEVWSLGWGDFLVTNYDVVYASIDGRGSGFQSDENIYAVNRKLGTVEIEDQIYVTSQLLKQYQFLDGQRAGIWGWSYGGYATLMTLAKDTENVFKCGLSVAPPTDWVFYDTIYTERFMGLPTLDDNLKGYTDGSVINLVENLRGKDFMINHGVADDNVHFQHSMMLFRALEKADIPFIQNSYPEENHGIGGVKKFLYHTFDSFWTRCFNLKSVITK